MKTIAERLALQYPDSSANESAEVISLNEQMVGRHPAGAAHAVRRRRGRHPDRLRERRQPAARACVRSREGDGDPRRARRRPPPAGAAAAGGEPRARDPGGGLGLLLAYLAIPPVQAISAGSIPRVNGHRDRRLRARLFARGDASHRDGLRPRARLAGLAAGDRRGPQGGRAARRSRRAGDCCGTV